jgi:hypothetical protein
MSKARTGHAYDWEQDRLNRVNEAVRQSTHLRPRPGNEGPRPDQSASRMCRHVPLWGVANLRRVAADRQLSRAEGESMLARKLPIEIEVVRINATDFNGSDWDGNPFDEPAPGWLMDALKNGTVSPGTPRDTDYSEWKIKTREGEVWAGPGDYIARGVEGEIYPIGGSIFAKTYEIAP